MKSAVGIFTTRSAADHAVERLYAAGFGREQISLLTPGSSPTAQLAAVPTTDAEQPGHANVLGAVVGGAAGASSGLMGAAVVSALVPGVGPVMAIGLAAAAILGLGGAVAGAAAGGAIEGALAEGLPKDELFVYEDALRQGRTVLIVVDEREEQVERAHDVLEQAGAESLDAAREHWWLGVRDAEAESYQAEERDFARDEALYRQGFEAALRADIADKSDDEALDDLEARHPGAYREAAFRQGYARGRAYRESTRGSYRGS